MDKLASSPLLDAKVNIKNFHFPKKRFENSVLLFLVLFSLLVYCMKGKNCQQYTAW